MPDPNIIDVFIRQTFGSHILIVASGISGLILFVFVVMLGMRFLDFKSMLPGRSRSKPNDPG